MRYITLFISVLFSLNLLGQNIDGTWISVARLDVVNDSTYLTKSDSLSPYEPITADSAYFNQYGLILEFMDNQDFKFGGIGTELKTGKYQLSNEEIHLKIDTVFLLAQLNGNQLIILDQDTTNWQSSHIILQKLNPNSTITPKSATTKITKNKYWKFSGDSLSNSFGMSLYFADTSTVIINRITDQWNTGTTSGTYKLRSYQNNLFLYIFDEFSMDEILLRVYSAENNNYLATSYEQGWYTEIPSKHEILIKRNPIPTNRQLKRIKKDLIGHWTSNLRAFPFDPELSDYESIEDCYFEFIFSEETFKIEYGGVMINDSTKTPKKVEYNGAWEIGKTGNYLLLTTNEGYTKYLTLVEINQTEALISMNTKAVDSDWVDVNHSIELSKAGNRR